MALAIEVQDLTKTYTDGLFRRRKVEALRGVSLGVEKGEIFGLLGPNGAGKTTLIKALLGIVRPSSGLASLLGHPLGDRRGRRRVGFLPEHHRIPRHHTGNSALYFYGALSGLSRREIRQRGARLLEEVGLAEWGKVSVRKYSKGMQQRLGLAQALLHDPELLILDEPTDGVDAVGRSQIRALLPRLKAEGKTIFVNSHQLQEIEIVCDRVAILDGGRVARVATVQALTGQAAGAEFQFTLLGEERAIRVAIGSRTVKQWQASSGRVEVTLELLHQTALDATVDALRQQGVSIVALAPKRQTLEEAFLNIVAAEVVDSSGSDS